MKRDRNIRVLHVDDDEDFLNVSSEIIEKNSNLETEPTTDAEDALKILNSEDIDCVISDYRMPDMDGLEFLERVRQNHPEIPFIFFTGEGNEEIASEAISVGITDYIQKEAGSEQYDFLVNRIENVVAQRRAQEEIEKREKKLEALLSTTRNIMKAETKKEVCEIGVETVRSILDFPNVAIYLDEENGDLRRIVSSTEDEISGEKFQKKIKRVYNTGVDDISEEIILAIENHGVLVVGSEHGESFKGSDVRFAKIVASNIRAALESVKDENRLRAERDRFMALFDNIPNPVVHSKPDLERGEPIVKDINPAFEDIFGYSEEEIVGESLDEYIVPPEKMDEADEINKRLMEKAKVRAEVSRMTTEGMRDFVLQAVTHRHGDDLESYTIYTDITERKKREEKIREERDRTSALFENATDCIVETEFVDGEPIVRGVNPAFEDVFGYSEEVILGESLDDYIVPAEKDEESDKINEGVQDGNLLSREVQRKTKDGLRDFLLRTVPLHEGEKENLQTYAVYTDITERKERQKELERQNERLEEFANVVSHDLRNPLEVASGYFGMIKGDIENQEFAEKVENAHDRMERIIDDVLTLARQGKTVSDTEEIELKKVVDRCWSVVETSKAELVSKVSMNIKADRDRLSQVFENLYRNAVEHGGKDVTITVGELDNGFYVEDNGPGIPEEEKDEIFEHGYTTNDQGTGFGLSIVQSVAEAHGWEVSVTDGKEGGARFEIRGVETQ